MKIGIFGDSFANHYRNDCPSWVQLLTEKYDVTCYAEPASSFYFSVEKFHEHHKKFDRIIFCITGGERIYLPEHSSYSMCPNNELVAYQTRHAYPWVGDLNTPLSGDTRSMEIVQAVKYYYMYIHNRKASEYYHQLSIKDVESARPDGLFFKGELWDVSFSESDHYSKDKNLSNFQDLRNCHMTNNNNQILAELVDKWIHGQPVSFTLDQFDLPPSEPFEKYFIPVTDQH